MDYESLAKILGAPAVLLIWMWSNTRSKKEPPPDAATQLASDFREMNKSLASIKAQLSDVQDTAEHIKTGVEVLKDRGKR